MSFSSKVKEELYKHFSTARHCQIAEITAILHFCGQMECRESHNFLVISAENALVIRKCFTLLKKTFNISNDVEIAHQGKGAVYSVRIEDPEQVRLILQSTKFLDLDMNFYSLRDPVNSILIKNSCCQRAFLRGAFLAAGSMSDPEKSYHLEVVCSNEPQAEQIRVILQNFDIEAKIVQRKKYFVVYIKEGSSISDFLNVTEAHVALMEFENFRIVKDMRNSINRRVNCETANIGKTVNAAARQTEDILFLRDHYGFERLPESLREMAEVRLEHQDAPLKELGSFLDPPVGKSGVNHRLRKLSELADRIRS